MPTTKAARKIEWLDLSENDSRADLDDFMLQVVRWFGSDVDKPYQATVEIAGELSPIVEWSEWYATMDEAKTACENAARGLLGL